MLRVLLNCVRVFYQLATKEWVSGSKEDQMSSRKKCDDSVVFVLLFSVEALNGGDALASGSGIEECEKVMVDHEDGVWGCIFLYHTEY